MAPVLIAILSLTVLGIPIVLALDRHATPLRVLGLAFLYGAGAISFVLLALSVLHIRWSLLSVTIAALLVGGSAGVRAGWIAGVPPARGETPPSQPPGRQRSVIDLFTLATPLGYTLLATIAPLWEWDFWAIWGLKARVFLEHGGIDWHFLTSPWNTFVHPDYPLLVPLVYDFAALVNGGWSDRWLGLLGVAWAVAFLLVARDLAAREARPFVAALIAFAIAPLAVSRFVGLAEGALIAYGGAALLFLRRGDDRHGAILLGLAACTKNEGLALIVSAAIAVALIDVKRVVRLWPVAAIAMPWLLLRALHHFPNEFVSGPLLARFAARLHESGMIVTLLLRHLYQPWLWAAILLGILFAWKRERFMLIACGLQLAFYVAAYFVTPRDVEWHIATSWPRLTAQIAAPLAFAVMVELARHAEARSEQP